MSRVRTSRTLLWSCLIRITHFEVDGTFTKHYIKTRGSFVFQKNFITKIIILTLLIFRNRWARSWMWSRYFTIRKVPFDCWVSFCGVQPRCSGCLVFVSGGRDTQQRRASKKAPVQCTTYHMQICWLSLPIAEHDLKLQTDIKVRWLFREVNEFIFEQLFFLHLKHRGLNGTEPLWNPRGSFRGNYYTAIQGSVNKSRGESKLSGLLTVV